MRRSVVFGVSAAALVAVSAGFAVHAANRSAERRWANLSACLIGEPLGAGETASQRWQAIELAKPFEKQRVEGFGRHARLVPEQAVPEQERWPARCQGDARSFAQALALLWLAPGARSSGAKLHEELLDGKVEPATLRAVFAAAAGLERQEPEHAVPRPWPPVELLSPKQSATQLAKACPALGLLASIDVWERDTIALGGSPGCVIRAHAGRPLAELGLGSGASAARRDKLHGARAATIAGQELSVENGIAKLGATELGPAQAFSTCNLGSLRVLVLESTDPAAIDVRFVEEGGVSGPARVELRAPRFPGNGESEVTRGRLTVNCQKRQARVGWAWSSAVDQRHRHELSIARCEPGRCEVVRARLDWQTRGSQGCGYCSLRANPRLVESPRVIDLFGSVAVVAERGRSLRARIAPLDALKDASDIVLWVDDDELGYWNEPALLGRGEVALIGASTGHPTAKSRLFRIDANGASELVVE